MVMARLDFIDCPLCAGHEKITEAAMFALSWMLITYMDDPNIHLTGATRVELANISNAMLNRHERNTDDELLS